MDFKSIQEFLIELKFNNNRPWFKENEKRYKAAKQEFSSFIDELIVELKKFDKSIDVESSKECLFRIFRDVRFSKNKEPYKTNFGAFISKGGRKSNYAGYYVHFEPDQSFIGGGIYMPQGPVLKAIRTEIFHEPETFKKIVQSKEFSNSFDGIFGDKLKLAPKGFSKDFEDIELLKHKHYAVSHDVSNDFWLKGNVLKKTVDVFKVQQKLNEFLNKAVDKVKEND